MSLPPSFSDLDADELARRLLRAGRADRAPAIARARALARVTALPLSAAAAAGSGTAAAAVSTAGSAWVAAKWMAVSLLVTWGGLSAVDVVQRPSETPSPLARAAQPQRPTAGAASAPAPSLSASPAPRVTTSGGTPRAQPPLTSAPSLAEARATVPAPPDGPRPPPAEPSNTAQLAREVAALELVRAALERGEGSRALAILSAYHDEFPIPVLFTEARALRVEIAFALKEPSARARADSFLSQHGESPLAARVRTFVDHHQP